MKTSIVKQLVIKDLQLMKPYAIGYWLSGVLAVLIAIFSGDVGGVVAMILFVAALFGAGVHSAMLIVEERREQTLAFVMSLPITVREYTSAKLISNLLLIGAIWLTLSAASYVIFIGETMPNGTVPFMTIVLISIFVAYIVVLATTLIFETITPTIVAMVAANLVTQALLWWIVDLHGIRSTIGGQVPVWNGTVLTVMFVQGAVVIGLLVATYLLQARKTEFV
jgi:ABC-type transport system involved in multi-copper enzyme maturation permease subunit